MTRRTALSLLGAVPAHPGTIRYREYWRVLPDHLRRLAQSAYEKRNRTLEGLTSLGAIAERQRWIRETFWQLIGGQPDRTPLNLRRTGGFERAAYTVENVIYESRPGVVIPANLYVPKQRQGRLPGVLFQMGHSLNGKAADPYQKCCQGLAKLGYVVLAFDPMGQGERTAYPDAKGLLTRLGSADAEHTLPGMQLLLAGDTATRLQTWDAVRSLDVLAAHAAVDPNRLGSTGQSGGGTLTMMLAAVDDRLAAAAVSCGNTENFACANFNPPGSTDDAEQDLIGAAPLGLDRWDLLWPMAPKPLLVLASARDSFGTYSPQYLENGREEFAKLQRIYKLLGKEKSLAWDETPLPHGLAYGLRLQVYNWFEKWLRGSDRRIESEPETAPEAEKTLWAGPSGNVFRDFHAKKPQALAVEAASRPTKPKSAQELLPVHSPQAVLRVIASIPGEHGIAEGAEVESAPGIFLPLWRFVPPKYDRTIVTLEPRGRNARWREGELYPELARRGALVVAADLRGLGDLTGEVGRGNPFYTRPHASEENFAWASLMLGDPLLAQRVTDIRALVQAHAGRRLILCASGHVTVPALWAAALEPGIDTLYLSGGLADYRSILLTEEPIHELANLLPGVLNHTDLPQIAAERKAKRLVLAGMTDAAGKTIEVPAAQKLYPGADVRPRPDWSLAALAAL